MYSFADLHGIRFSTLFELIEHYKKAPIYTSPKGEKMFLIKPFSRPQL